MFKKQGGDAIAMLHAIACCGTGSSGPAFAVAIKAKQVVLAEIPNGFRGNYRVANVMDLERTEGLIAESRNNPAASGPNEVPWFALLDYAIA